MQKSIATVSLSGTLPEKLEAAAAVGFDGVEIFENDLLTFDGSPEEVRTIAGNLGLAITLFQPFRDFEAMPEPRRAQNLGRAERKFDVMQALGTDLVLVCSNTHAATANDDSRAAADLAAMAERAERREFRAAPARLMARDGLRSLLWLERRLARPACRLRRYSTASNSSNSQSTMMRHDGLASSCVRWDCGMPGIIGPRRSSCFAMAA